MSTTLIGLTGRKRSGKDTVGQFLQTAGLERVAFGDPIKRILADLNPYVDGARISGSFAESSEMFGLLNSMLGAISRHTSIHSSTIEDAAKALDILDPFVTGTERLGTLLRHAGGDWEKLKDEENDPRHREIRRLQQVLGTEVGREILPGSVWVDTGMAKADAAALRGASIVITDCRFDDEAEAVRAAGGKVVRIVRPSLPEPTDSHASEAGISDHLVDREIVNEGTLADLRYATVDLLGRAEGR